jgi:hypothetical protein
MYVESHRFGIGIGRLLLWFIMLPDAPRASGMAGA